MPLSSNDGLLWKGYSRKVRGKMVQNILTLYCMYGKTILARKYGRVRRGNAISAVTPTTAFAHQSIVVVKNPKDTLGRHLCQPEGTGGEETIF